MSDAIKVITNGHHLDVIDGAQLTAAERADFDYVDFDAIERGEDSASFVRYRGDVIDLGDMMTTSTLPADNPLRAWDGYASDSFFSGIVVRYVDDFEGVVIGRYVS